MGFRLIISKSILMNFVIVLTAGSGKKELPLRLLNACLAHVPVKIAEFG